MHRASFCAPHMLCMLPCIAVAIALTIATGEMHSVREFVERAFALVGRDWQKFVEIDPRYFRPTEVDELRGDATKARERLGWRPATTFAELVRLMVEADLREAGLDPDEHMVALAAGPQ